MDTQEKPQRISTPGQPDTYIPERKSLSAQHHVTDEMYLKNKLVIQQYRMHKLEQLKKQEDAK